MADFTLASITGMCGSCPVCESDLFWVKTPVHVEPLSDDRRSASLWPPGSSCWEPAGEMLLECAGCGLQFRPEILGTAGPGEELDSEGDDLK